METKRFYLNGLGCANCAQKIQDKVSKMDNVEDVSLNFSTSILKINVSKEDYQSVKEKIQQIVTSLEPDVIVEEKDTKKRTSQTRPKTESQCKDGDSFSIESNDSTVIETKRLFLKGLGCANCAQKIQDKVSKMNSVEDVSLNFSTSILKINVYKKDYQSVKKEIQQIVTSLEPDVVVEERDTKKRTSQTRPKAEDHSQDIHNHEECDCGHDHSQEHKKHDGVDVHSHAGHTHENEPPKNVAKTKLIISAVVAVAAIVLGRFFAAPELVTAIMFGASIVIAGSHVLKQGVKNLFKLEFEENFLLTIAVIAAFFIGEYMEATLVMLLFTLGNYIEGLAVAKSRRDISELTNIRPDTANLITENGDTVVTMAEDIYIDDMILIKAGDRVPLDCEIITGNSTIDNSAMTGESIPITVEPGDKLLSGAINQSGLLKCKVVNTFEDSAASRIVELVEQSVEKKGNTETFITRFARIYTPIIMILSVIFAVVPPLLGFGDFNLWIGRSLVFLVSSCPCAFVIAVPLGMYSAIGANSKTGVLVKGGKYIEILSRTDTVVMDKTGTLTSGKLGVEKIVSHSNSLTEENILELCALAEINSNHPIAKSIVSHYGKDVDTSVVVEYEEIAGMGVVVTTNDGVYLCGSGRMMEKNNINVSKYDPSNIYLAKDGKLLGQIFIADQIKPSSKTVVSSLNKLGVNRVVMLTGDAEPAAKAVAAECNIKEYKSGLLPQDKVSQFEQIKNDNNTCLFVGDGINDAPALAMADAGVAIGMGSDIAIESSDVVLMSGDLKDLANAVSISKQALFTIKCLIALAMGTKLIVQVLGIFGLLGFAAMGLAVFADVGVSIISIIVATRIMNYKGSKLL